MMIQQCLVTATIIVAEGASWSMMTCLSNSLDFFWADVTVLHPESTKEQQELNLSLFCGSPITAVSPHILMLDA